MPKFYKTVHGWFDFEPFYEKVVRSADEGRVNVFVEVGVWQGKSLIFLAETIREHGASVELYAVDNWSGGPEVMGHVAELEKPYLQIFKDNLEVAGCTDMVNVIEGDSAKSAEKFEDESVDFAFIDACHEYASVKADIEAWWPKVVSGGLLAGHDYQIGFPGVMKAVNDFASQQRVRVVKEHGNVWAIRKP